MTGTHAHAQGHTDRTQTHTHILPHTTAHLDTYKKNTHTDTHNLTQRHTHTHTHIHFCTQRHTHTHANTQTHTPAHKDTLFCFVLFDVLHLASRWKEFQRLADRRKLALESALNIQNYHLECTEIQSWMKEKTRVIESTQSLGNDLAGVMALQRKLTGMERDLEAIQVHCVSQRSEPGSVSTLRPNHSHSITHGLALQYIIILILHTH